MFRTDQRSVELQEGCWMSGVDCHFLRWRGFVALLPQNGQFGESSFLCDRFLCRAPGLSPFKNPPAARFSLRCDACSIEAGALSSLFYSAFVKLTRWVSQTARREGRGGWNAASVASENAYLKPGRGEVTPNTTALSCCACIIRPRCFCFILPPPYHGSPQNHIPRLDTSFTNVRSCSSAPRLAHFKKMNHRKSVCTTRQKKKEKHKRRHESWRVTQADGSGEKPPCHVSSCAPRLRCPAGIMHRRQSDSMNPGSINAVTSGSVIFMFHFFYGTY